MSTLTIVIIHITVKISEFSATTLKLALFADDTNKGVYDKAVKIPMEACDVLTCPMEMNVRRLFDVDFVLGKTLGTVSTLRAI